MSFARAGVAALLVTTAVGGFRLWTPGERPQVRLRVEPSEIAANGNEQALLTIESSAEPRVSLEPARRGTLGRLRQSGPITWVIPVRAGVDPGTATLRAEVDGNNYATAAIQLHVDLQDREGDGMPDAVELDAPEDQTAFRRWFTFLAEVQFFQPAGRLPVEINDCAALIRYAYREALRPHDSRWTADVDLPLLLPIQDISKVQYPYTMLGASLFRVKPGSLKQEDLTGGAFSQFADAKTLRALNAHFISRDLNRAEPGDLLFFRHESADMPFHAMIYLGRSQVRDDGHRYLLYHTGPDGGSPGEIRRPTVEQLAAHPNPGWRPLAGNPTFLGIYRWNILR